MRPSSLWNGLPFEEIKFNNGKFKSHLRENIAVYLPILMGFYLDYDVLRDNI